MNEEEKTELPENVVRVNFRRNDKNYREDQGVANLIKDIEEPKNFKLRRKRNWWKIVKGGSTQK